MNGIEQIEHEVSQYQSEWRNPNLDAFEISNRYDIECDWKKNYYFAERTGCYVLLDVDLKIVYVGKASLSSCLGKRIDTYFRRSEVTGVGEPKHKWVNPPRYFVCISVLRAFEAPSLEEFLIARLEPSENTIGR